MSDSMGMTAFFPLRFVLNLAIVLFHVAPQRTEVMFILGAHLRAMTFPIQLLTFLIECHCPTPREKPVNARIRVRDNGTDSKQEYDGGSGGPEEKKGPLFFSVLESSWKKRHFCNRQVIKEHKCRKRGYKHSPWELGGQRSSS